MNVPKVKYSVVYNGKDITTDLLPHVINYTYADKTHGEADEFEILMEDTAQLWANEWYPSKGDTITASIIDKGRVLNCGEFTVDEITCDGSKDIGNTVKIRAIAAGVNKKVRSKNSYAHENKTLREIANTIASKHGLKLSGKIEDITIGRVTQYDETDLAFLHRLASDYGYSFSIRGTSLVFHDIFDLENKDASLQILKSEIINYSISDKNNKTYKSVKVRHKHPRKKHSINYDEVENDPEFADLKDDILLLKTRAENTKQAERKGKVALHKHNTAGKEGSIEMPGNIYALAGNTCEVVGIGLMSGKYFINASTHTVDKDGGYTTSLEIKRVALVDKTKQKT